MTDTATRLLFSILAGIGAATCANVIADAVEWIVVYIRSRRKK
jgi:hypothetical protein